MMKRMIFPVLILGATLTFVLWPLFRPGFFISDDGEWMVIRLSAFYQSLASGQFPVRFLGRLNNSYGYPVANFLYPGFLYIGSILHLAGFTFVDAVKVIMGVSVAGGALAMYGALRSKFQIPASIIGSASFVFSPYLLYDLYRRGSVGEILAIGVSAIVLLSITRGWVWLLAPALGLLIISHNTVSLMVIVAVACLLLVHREKNRFILSGGLGVGAATFFWLPAIVERGLVQFDETVVADFSRYFITPESALLLGLPTVIALGILLGMKRPFRPWDIVMMIIVTTGLVMSLPVSRLLWQGQVFSPFVQFPYRFLALTVVFGPWIVASAYERLKGGRAATVGVIFLFIWGYGVWSQMQEISYVNRPISYYTTNEGTTTVKNEYMPRWVSEVPTKRPVETLEVIDGDAFLSERTFIGEHMEVDIEAKETSVVRINKIYYPGWGITIDNSRVPIDYRSPTGVMWVNVPKGTHRLAVAFRETPFRFAADLVSLCSVIGFVTVVGRLRAHT